MTASAPPVQPIRVLLVEDDPDDFVLTRALLSEAEGVAFEVKWAQTYAQGLEALRDPIYDIVLLDHRLGEQTGLHFLGRLPVDVRIPPVILLTGQGDRETDLAAMKAGAADYLPKEGLSATMLERAIRYAIEQRRGQEDRRAAELRYQTLVQSIGAIVWQADAETSAFSLVSREAEHILGYPVEQWIEDPEFWSSHLHPEDREWVVRECKAAIRRGEEHSLEYRMIAADGRVVWLADVVRVLNLHGRRELAGVMVDITERKKAESLLRRQERALAAISEGILITDPRQPDNPIVYANAAFEQLTGYTADEVRGRNCRLLQGLDTDPAVIEAIRSAVEAGERFMGEILNYRKNGTPFWNRLSITPIRDQLGTVAHFVGVQQDVTERRRLIQELEGERSRLADVFQQAPAFMATVRGPEHIFEMTNPPYDRLVGRSGLPGKTVREALPEVVEQGIVELLDRVYASGEPFVANEMPMMLQREEGAPAEERILNFVYQPLRESDGSISGILAHGVDVTEQVRAQENHRLLEEHYRRLVTNAPLTIYALDADGRFIELNPAAEALLRRPAGELLGQHAAAVVAPEDLPIAEALFQRALSGTVEAVGEELHIVRSSGEKRLLSVTIAPIHNGSITGAHGIARDITDERQQAHRMRLLATALDGSQEGVSISTAEGDFLYANTAHAQILGYEPGSLAATGLESFLPNEAAREHLVQVIRTVREGGSWSGRVEWRRLSDGRMIPLDIIIGRVVDDGEDLLFSIIKDATEAITREQHLRRTERLASVGTLIAGVAHELNNPLHAIRSFSELMLMDPREEDDRESLEIIRREAERAAKVVSDLRLFARDTQEGERERTLVDLNDVVRHILKVRRYALATGNVELREDLAADLPPVLANRGEMEQVILNLTVNAEQAMAEQPGERRLIVRTRRTPGGASIHIVDSGPGIAPADLERIYDPFFTTKSAGEGTGLGLSLVHGIITEHQGTVHVESEPGKGTAFRIDLPRAGSQEVEHGAVSRPAAPVRALQILLVDDEESIRRVATRFLERRGHRVDAAAEGEEALRLLNRREYDVIVSDLRMPGLGGEALFQRLQERGGGLERRLIFVTGDAATAQTARMASEANVPVLIKPVRLEDLARVVEAVGQERTSGGG